MQGLLICCLFLLLWKGLDLAVNCYQMHLQVKVEMNRPAVAKVEEEPADVRTIGFTGPVEINEEDD